MHPTRTCAAWPLSSEVFLKFKLNSFLDILILQIRVSAKKKLHNLRGDLTNISALKASLPTSLEDMVEMSQCTHTTHYIDVHLHFY